MHSLSKNNIDSSVKKHLGFAMLLATSPIVFIKGIVFFSGESQLDSLLTVLVPLTTVGACGHFVKCVLTDIAAPKASGESVKQ